MMMIDPRKEAVRRASREQMGATRPEGRERPQANAIKLGLAEESPRVPEDSPTIQERSKLWYYPFKPQHAFHAWLVDQVSISTLRIERAGRMERRMRDRSSIRAEMTWDDDRRIDAETVGSGLSRGPSAVVKRLRQTLQGVEWLMERWAMLARLADLANNTWDENRRKLAFDLLGTPPEAREGGDPGQVIDEAGQPIGLAPSPADLARGQAAALDALRDDLADADALDQSLAEADLVEPTSPEYQGVRRYEATLYTRLRWLTGQLRIESPWKSANPSLQHYFDPLDSAVRTAPIGPTPAYIPVAAVKPIPAPEPEVEDEDEAEDDPDRPAVIARLGPEPRAKKARDKRQARDRKQTRRKG